MSVKLGWKSDGFAVLCAALGHRVEGPAVPHVVPGVGEWLERELPKLERVAIDWPGRPIRAELLISGKVCLVVQFSPGQTSWEWEASVETVAPPCVDVGEGAVSEPLDGARLMFAPVGVIQAGGLVLDELARRAWVDDIEGRFTRIAFELLRTLASRPDEAISRTELRERVWRSRDVSDKAIDEAICVLRRTLGGRRRWIATVRGFGYRFDASSRGGEENGDLRIDRGARRVYVNGDECALGRMEYDLLCTLAGRPDEAISYTVLSDGLWHSTPGTRRLLNLCVARLCAKLGDEARRIGAVRGFGYRFDTVWPGAEEFGDCELWIDRAARRVWVKGVEIALTRAAFDLLVTLPSGPGEAIGSTELCERLGLTRGGLKTGIVRLRAKLGAGARWIVHVRGRGYRLQARVTVAAAPGL